MDKGDNFIQDLLIMAAEKNASDLHLMADAYTIFRVMGKLVLFEAAGLMNPTSLLGYIGNLMTQTQREVFLKELELDF